MHDTFTLNCDANISLAKLRSKHTGLFKDCSMNFENKIETSINRLEMWIEQRNYKGYDPGDGLNSALRPLTFGNQIAERILLQIVWKAPFNLRPLIGILPMESTKGRGYMASGYLLRNTTTGNPDYKAKAMLCLDWLKTNQTSRGQGIAWGNHFDFVTRSGCNPAGSPIIVWTSLIGQAFLEAFEQTRSEQYLDVARGICTWVLDLPREKTSTGTCLSYVPFAQTSIHNSNMLGAAILAKTWKYTGEDRLYDVAKEAVEYSCSRQRGDGSWWYGEEQKYHWIDSFHTGYNLDSLLCYIESTGDTTYSSNLERGLEYYSSTFFESSGVPRYYHNRTQPIDIQCAAQAIETLAKCSQDAGTYIDSAIEVANWTIDNMQDRSGYFYFRKYPLLMSKVPYIHWGQATMYKALAILISKLNRSK